MKAELNKLNTWINETIRKEHKQAETAYVQALFLGGVILPFGQHDIEDPLVINKCVPELSIIFETKKRAPFKVVFEVTKFSEVLQNVLARSGTSKSGQSTWSEHTQLKTSYEDDLSNWAQHQLKNNIDQKFLFDLPHPNVFTDPFK